MTVITYFNTLYNRESQYNVVGEIKFADGYAEFCAGGHKRSIKVENIISIVPLER